MFAALTTGVMLVSSLTPAFASENSFVVTGNGYDSKSEVEFNSTNTQVVTQDNKADVSNNVNVNASTGGNEADKNTGGDVKIDTGDAAVSVQIENKLNSNKAKLDCCDSGDLNVEVSENGADTYNKVKLNEANTNTLFQTNAANVQNTVNADAKTGKNEANKNTGGDVSIETGDADVIVGVKTVANSNSAVIGGEGSSSDLSAVIKGNGYDSKNKIYLDLAKVNTLTQANSAIVANNVDVDAQTGKNEADKNTGGDVKIDTGDAFAGVMIENKANWNWADVPCDCVFGDVLAKVAGNGADSYNKIDADLTDALVLFQNNDADLDNNVDIYSKTGYNDADKNTGDVDSDPSIYTGDADALVEVSNYGDSNVYGSPFGDWPWHGSEVDVNVSINIAELMALLGL